MRQTLDLGKVQTFKNDFAKSFVPPKHLVPIFRTPVLVIGTVEAPAYGTQVTILEYVVRANYACLLTGIVLGYSGNPPAPLPGDIFWDVDIDRPLGSIAGYIEKDYQRIVLPLGSFTFQPWPCEFSHRDNEVIRVKGVTNANVATGPGNFLTAALYGFEWPEGSV